MRLPPLSTLLVAFCLVTFSQADAANEIPFQFRDGMIWVKVAVQGQRSALNFLVDSGAGVSVLHLQTARDLGIKLDQAETIQGVHTRSTAYPVNRFSGEMSGVPAPRRMLALDLSAVSAECHQRIDGLIGADFFRGRIVQIDFATQKLRLLDRSELNADAREVLPLARRNDAMCVRVGVAGHPAEWMRVDTGCNSALEWVVTGAKAKTLGGTSVGISSGSVRKVSADVQLGSHRLADVSVGVHSRQIFRGEAGLLGNGLLSKFTVTIDADKGRLLLAKR